MSADQAQAIEQQIDNFLNQYVQTHGTSTSITKFTHAKFIIQVMLDSAHLSTIRMYILTTLQERIVSLLETLEELDDQPDDQPDEQPSPVNIDVSTYEEGAKTIVAGVESDPVIRFELVANLEKVSIEQFSLEANYNDFDEIIKYVRVYNEAGELVAIDRPNDNNTVFTPEELIIDKWSNYFYITLEPYRIGDSIQTPQTATFTLEWTTDIAKWVTSKSPLPSTSKENDDDSITVVPIAISSIELLDSFGGRHVDETLYDQVESNLAIVRINFAESTNTNTESAEDLEALLHTFGLVLYDTTQSSPLSSIELQRIDITSSSVPWETNDEGFIEFDLDDLGSNKNIVTPGKSVVFLITVRPTLDDEENESIGIELDNEIIPILSYTTTDSTSPVFDTENTQPQYIGSRTLRD